MTLIDNRGVLLVEDDPLVARVTILMLKKFDLLVHHVETAEEAWCFLRDSAGKLHFILSDMNLRGGQDGVELLHDVHQQFPEIPLMLTTGSAIDPPEFILDCLQKPTRLNDVRASLEQHGLL